MIVDGKADWTPNGTQFLTLILSIPKTALLVVMASDSRDLMPDLAFALPAGGRPAQVGLGDERGLCALRKPGGQRGSGQPLHGLQHQVGQSQDHAGTGRAHR